MATRDDVVNAPRSGARPLGGSDPGSGVTRSYPRYSRSDSVPAQRTSGSRPVTPAPGRPAAATRPGGSRRSSSPARQVRRQYNAHVTTNYERVIVAEFVLAVLLVAATPFTRSNKNGISPYYGQDMVQIVAIMAAYFILGLVAQAGGATARISAWFGGLLLLGIGLGEAAYLAKVFNIFGASSSSSSSSSGGSAAPSGPTPPGPPVPEGALNG